MESYVFDAIIDKVNFKFEKLEKFVQYSEISEILYTHRTKVAPIILLLPSFFNLIQFIFLIY